MQLKLNSDEYKLLEGDVFKVKQWDIANMDVNDDGNRIIVMAKYDRFNDTLTLIMAGPDGVNGMFNIRDIIKLQ